ncbi:MAG: extracellular solute-binding protein [Hyphomicrobiales bacterium]|nr:extracellular solute-binding protein [Hyphomicrobiales bacterium]
MNLAQMQDNPNIRIFFPVGPNGKKTAFALPYYIGLVANAPNAENGKKLIDFLLSPEAQSEVSSVGQGLPVRTDVHPTDENFKRVNAMLEGIDVWTPDWDKVLADLQKDVASYNQTVSGN